MTDTKPHDDGSQPSPPTTAWGTLLRAADVLEASPGLARVDTLKKDHKAGKLTVFDAIVDALWPPPGPAPYLDGIPQSSREDPRCALYWAAVTRLASYCGWTKQHTIFQKVDKIDWLTEKPEATAASIAAHMRKAAGFDTLPGNTTPT